MHQAVEEGHVGAGVEAHVVVGVVGDLGPPRVGDDQGGAVVGGLLDEGRRHRVVVGGVGADDENGVGVQGVGKRVRHRAAADLVQQGGDRRGVAQPRAVVDVVGAEDGANELLEQVVVLVRALGGAEAGQRLAAVRLADGREALRRHVEGLVPSGFPERLARVGGRLGGLRIILRLANQRHQQTLAVVHVIEAVAALDAQPPVVHRAGAPGHLHDGVGLGVHRVGDAAADAAVGAQGVDLLVVTVRQQRQGEGLVGQRAGRAGGHALAAGDAARLAHRQVVVEGNARRVALAGAPDDVVALHVVAGADAAVAQDAGIVVHGDDRRRQVVAVVERARRESAAS